MSLLVKHLYRFGEFAVDSDQRVLLRNGKPRPLTPKVFDTLLILVENSGRIVEKDHLMCRLWPNTFVEEANLAFNVQQVRKALGDNARKPRYVETIPRRGYRFIAAVEEVLSDVDTSASRVTQESAVSDKHFSAKSDRTSKAADARHPSLRESVTPDALTGHEENQGRAGAAHASSDRSIKKFISLAAAIILVVTAVSLLLWKALSSSQDSGHNRAAARNLTVRSTLKIEQLTQSGQSKNVAISPDGKYVAYTRHFEQKSSIWLRQLATNTNIEIVPPSGIIYGLSFNNSGENLFFTRRVDPNAYRGDLYRVSALGGAPTKIVDDVQGSFSISGDDRQLAFLREAMNGDGQREHHLMIVNADGSGERTVFIGTHPDDLDAPVWSPDGQSIIFACGSSHGGAQKVSLIEVRIADGMKKELSTDRFFHISKMAWVPGKSGLVITGRKLVEETNQLWRLSYPSMEITQLTESQFPYSDLSIASAADKAVATQAIRVSDIWIGSSHAPRNLKKITQALDYFCWTPNGRLIYQSTASSSGDLWMMQPDGSEQKQLTSNARLNEAPAVTPDNHYIVFTSNRSGSSQIWRMNLDSSNQMQLTSRSDSYYPSVSPDGKWVLYNTTDDWHLWRVSIDGGEPTRLTDYLSTWPSVSPDGKMIACMGRNQSKRELLILPFEGGQPLKRIEFDQGDFSTSRVHWSPDGKSLIYAAERNGTTVLLRQPLDGSPPEEIMYIDEDELFDFGYSFDGQWLAVTRGGWQNDIVLISGW